MSEIKHATDETFESLVINNDKPVVVDVVKVDVDANPKLSQAFGIMSIPTIAYFKPGAQPQGVTGFRKAEDLEAVFGLASGAPSA